MENLKIKFALFLTAVLFCTTALVAQNQQRPGGGGRPQSRVEKSAEEMAKMKTDKMTESLKLDSKQQKSLYDLNLKYAKDTEIQRNKMKEAEKIISEVRTSMGESMKAQQKEVMGMLTDDQKIEFVNILSKTKRGQGAQGRGGKSPQRQPKRGGAPQMQGAPCAK